MPSSSQDQPNEIEELTKRVSKLEDYVLMNAQEAQQTRNTGAGLLAGGAGLLISLGMPWASIDSESFPFEVSGGLTGWQLLADGLENFNELFWVASALLLVLPVFIVWALYSTSRKVFRTVQVLPVLIALSLVIGWPRDEWYAGTAGIGVYVLALAFGLLWAAARRGARGEVHTEILG
ncbi:hypothetical protein [Nocardiopsis valliformis]|uniref:hypothetical protein n=1 Tax=Nocardiopsis valliformis TaxID=239974 RepID=UPI0003470F03|nr:hypothetical protein [Nocardiopsis valliformis]